MQINISKIFFYTSTHEGKNLMHGYDVHQALKNGKIRGHWARGSGTRVWSTWSYSENVLRFENYLLYSNIYLKKTKCIVIMFIMSSTSIVKCKAPRPGQGLMPKARQLWPYNENKCILKS